MMQYRRRIQHTKESQKGQTFLLKKLSSQIQNLPLNTSSICINICKRYKTMSLKRNKQMIHHNFLDYLCKMIHLNLLLNSPNLRIPTKILLRSLICILNKLRINKRNLSLKTESSSKRKIMSIRLFNKLVNLRKQSQKNLTLISSSIHTPRSKTKRQQLKSRSLT